MKQAIIAACTRSPTQLLRRHLAAAFDAYQGITSAAGLVSQWDDLSGNARHLLQATGANQPIHLPVGVNNADTAVVGSLATTLNLATSALAYNDAYNGMIVTLTGGTGSGQSRTITDYVGSTKVATVAAWDVTPDETTEYSISATRPSILFDGVAHFMQAVFPLNLPYSCFFVGKQLSWTSQDRLVAGVAANTGLIQFGSTPQIQLFHGSVAAANGDMTLGAQAVIGYVVPAGGVDASIVVNRGSATSGNTGANNLGGLTLGAINTGLGNYGNIQAQEVRIYSVAHNAAERAAIINYLMAKWGIA